MSAILAGLQFAWSARAWLIPAVLGVALLGAIAWAKYEGKAAEAAGAKAEQYKTAALSAEQAIDEMRIHQAHVDAAIGASHAAEVARLESLAKLRQTVAGGAPAPACPPDPIVLQGLEELRRQAGAPAGAAAGGKP